MGRALLAGACATILTVVAAAPAAGAVTFGSNLVNAPNSYPDDPQTLTIVDLPAESEAPGGAVAPTAGVIVRWRVRIGPLSHAFTGRVRVIRDGTTAVASGPLQSFPADAGTYESPVRMPVQPGDALGIDHSGPLGGAAIYHSGLDAGVRDRWEPPLGDVETRNPTGNNEPGIELSINADIEPDADGDGFGDETQDGCAGLAGPENGCPAGGRPTCNGVPATILGTEGAETIEGSPGPDVIAALGGADTVRASGGDDIVCGGDGNDEIVGASGNDRLRGDGGKDELNGQSGNDKLKGDAGADKLKGGSGDDRLNGGKGKDRCGGGGGKDKGHCESASGIP